VWSLPSGGLPFELSLSSDGQLTGTVSSPTNVSFVIRVTDSNGSFVDQPATLLVAAIAPPPVLVITSAATLSDVLEGSSYSWGFSATGGDGTYTWSLPNNGQPAGLSLSADGQLSGTLTATSNTYYFTVQVTDGNGTTANQSVSLNVSLPPPPQMVLSGQETLEASIWSPFAQSFAASGSQAACAWNLGGNIPPGLSISAEGVLSGTLDGTSTTYNFVVNVTDGYSSASQPVTFNVCDRDADGDGLAASLEHEIALESGYALHDGDPNSNGCGGGYCQDWLIYYHCRLHATDHLDDADGDGLGPVLEAHLSTDPTKADTDEDFYPDWYYAYQFWDKYFDTVDADNDGLHANLEALIGTSDDPVNGQDSDGDGLSDAWEWSNHFYSSPVDDDSDNDGLKDGEELNAQTQARDEDTDDDHLTDREEVMRVFDANLYLNPLNPDTDADGVPDFAEVVLTDTDGGGIPDRLEDFWGLDKNNPVDESWDVDSDDVSNVEAYEAGWDIFANWQPQFDGDGDGMDDIYELARPGYLNAWDRMDGADDPDADFLTNAEEYRERINPLLYLTPVRPSKRRTIMAPEGPRPAANDYEQAYGKVLNAANLVRGNGGWPGHASTDDWDQDGWSNFDELYPASGDPSDPRVHDYPLSISTAALPSAAVGVPYSAHFTVTGGKAPYQFGFGGILPAGLVVSETGVISGTPSPTTEGTYSCNVSVTDSRGTILDADPPPTLTVVGRPQMIGPLEINAEIGNLDIHAPIQVTGGLPPYQLAIIESTNVAGLSLSGNTLISPSGSAFLEDANLAFQVRITDALGQVVIQNCNLHVYAGGGGGGSITISASFPADVPGANYSVPVSASGGTGPYTFSISNGSLPGSLWLNPETNTISGQLSYAGTFAFTLRAVDAAGETATAPCSIVVSNSVMPLGLASVRCDVIAGQQFTQTLSGTGGTGGPYSIALDWERVPSDPLDATLKTLSLPEGVSYNGTTGLGGTPMQTGSYSIPVIVANGTGSAPATFILQVNSGGGAPPWAITTPAVLPDLLAGQPQTYFKQIEVADGAAYTLQFAVSGSSGLPAGLNLTSSGLLSGTPGVGVHTFQISVTDNLGRTESRAFTLHCTETPFAFTTPAPGISINGPVGKLMKFQFSTTTPFTAPRTFSMAPGSTLPEGCAISASGYFTYTSPVPKSFEFDLEVADATGRRSSGHFMVHIHAVGETPSGQTPPPGGGPDTEPKEPVEPFSFTYYHAAGSASSGGERRMVQDPFQYSQMPIYGEDPDGPGPVDPPIIGYYWRTGWIEAPETGATGWANDATRSVTFSGETFAENQNSLLNFMDGIMTGPGSSQPGQGASSSWTVGETVGNPILITGGECYFVPDETHVSTSPPASNATVSIGGAEACSLECIGLRGEVKSQAAPGASATFIFTWTEALTTDVGPPVIHYGTATLTNGTSGACWMIEGNGPITNAAPDPHDLLLKPPVIKGKTFSVGPLLPIEVKVVNRDDPTKTWTTGPVTSGPLAYTSPTISEVSDVKNGDLISWSVPGLTGGSFQWWATGPNNSRKDAATSVTSNEWKLEDPLDWLPGKWRIHCKHTPSSGSAVEFNFEQDLGYRSPHITVIGWINGNEIILPDGSDHPIQYLVPSGTGPTPVSIETIMNSFASRNIFLLELITGASYLKPLAPDGARRYVNSHLIKFSPNVEPQSDFTVDWPGKANRKMVNLLALRDFKSKKELFRAFHQFQVRFELDESAKIKGEPVYLISSSDTTEGGFTPTDVGNLPSELGPLNNKIVKAGESLQSNPKNGRTLTAKLPNDIAQINQGRISTIGVTSGGHLSKQLNNLVVPWIWSMITFSSSYASSGSTQVPQHEIFPSYHVLYNGRRIDSLTHHISSEKIEEFIQLGEAP
jgi:hypothetical protein